MIHSILNISYPFCSSSFSEFKLQILEKWRMMLTIPGYLSVSKNFSILNLLSDSSISLILCSRLIIGCLRLVEYLFICLAQMKIPRVSASRSVGSSFIHNLMYSFNLVLSVWRLLLLIFFSIKINLITQD